MGAYFQRRFVRVGIRPRIGTTLPPYVPSCSAPDGVAVEEWIWSGAAGHELVGRSRFANSDGRVLCVVGQDGRPSRIEWTTYIVGVYGYAEGPNFPALLRWWLETGGPLR